MADNHTPATNANNSRQRRTTLLLAWGLFAVAIALYGIGFLINR